jgi:hypothetical protein
MVASQRQILSFKTLYNPALLHEKSSSISEMAIKDSKLAADQDWELGGIKLVGKYRPGYLRSFNGRNWTIYITQSFRIGAVKVPIFCKDIISFSSVIEKGLQAECPQPL